MHFGECRELLSEIRCGWADGGFDYGWCLLSDGRDARYYWFQEGRHLHGQEGRIEQGYLPAAPFEEHDGFVRRDGFGRHEVHRSSHSRAVQGTS